MKFEQITNECVNMVEKAGFQVPKIEFKTKKYKSRYGQCEKKYGQYKITINEYLINTNNEKEIKDTIIHEILHTLPDCMNHGKIWKQKAMIINNRYNMDISRCGNFQIVEMQEAKEEVQYMFKCKDCGQIIKRKRMSKFVREYEHYHCAICKGKFERIL